MASPDRSFNFVDYVTVEEYQILECTGIQPGNISYANFPGGSGAPGPARVQQQGGNVGIMAEHICINPTADLRYSGTSMTNDFTLQLNDFAFEFEIRLSNGTAFYPVIRFNNLELSATGVFVNQGPTSNSPYGSMVAIQFEKIIADAVKGAAGFVQSRIQTNATTSSIERDLRAQFIQELYTNMQQAPEFYGATGRSVVADNNYSNRSTRTTWDPECTNK